MIKNIITSVDIISKEAMLYGNNKKKRIQNVFGGLVSILCFGLITSAIFFFTLKFLSYDNPNIVSSSQYKDDLVVEDFQDIPFMIRLSNGTASSYIDPLKYYRPVLNWITADLVDGKMIQTYNKIPMVQCDLNKHFGKYKDVFKDVPGIDTYFCNNINKKIDIKALYAGSKPYSFYFYRIEQCNTLAINNTCHSQEFLDSEL